MTRFYPGDTVRDTYTGRDYTFVNYPSSFDDPFCVYVKDKNGQVFDVDKDYVQLVSRAKVHMTPERLAAIRISVKYAQDNPDSLAAREYPSPIPLNTIAELLEYINELELKVKGIG